MGPTEERARGAEVRDEHGSRIRGGNLGLFVVVFMAFAAAILAGISIKGGRGSIVNVIGGILLLSVIEGGLTMVQMSVFMRQVIFGALVIVAIIVNRAREKLRDRILLPR